MPNPIPSLFVTKFTLFGLDIFNKKPNMNSRDGELNHGGNHELETTIGDCKHCRLYSIGCSMVVRSRSSYSLIRSVILAIPTTPASSQPPCQIGWLNLSVPYLEVPSSLALACSNLAFSRNSSCVSIDIIVGHPSKCCSAISASAYIQVLDSFRHGI